MNVNLCTNEKDIFVKYGLYDLGPEREMARCSLKYILADISDIKRFYVSLGFHLWEFNQCEYYKDFGYSSFVEFCEENIPLDKSSISRCMNVWHEFAFIQNGSYKNVLDEKYREFNYSQLTEMLSMDEKHRKLVTSDMTVAEIRKLKKKMIGVESETVMRFMEEYKKCVTPFTRENVVKQIKKEGASYRGHHCIDLSYDISPAGIRFDLGDTYPVSIVLDAYAEYGGTFENDEVATSQQKDSFIDKINKYKGAVLQSYVKNYSIDDCQDCKHITLYDADGKEMFKLETCDILFEDNNRLYLRISSVSEKED